MTAGRYRSHCRFQLPVEKDYNKMKDWSGLCTRGENVLFQSHCLYIECSGNESLDWIDNGEKDMRKMTRLINYNRVF